MDIVVKFLLDYIPDPRVFPGFMLLFGWLIWLILKVCQWPRPRISTMLIYTVSVAIAFYLQIPVMRACGTIVAIFEDRVPCPSSPRYRFLSDVVLWFIVIYVGMKLISRINQPHVNQLEKKRE